MFSIYSKDNKRACIILQIFLQCTVVQKQALKLTKLNIVYMSIIVSESYYRQIIKIIKNIYNASYFNPYYFCLKERKKKHCTCTKKKTNHYNS